jgi:arylsulfatase A-like enzyme
VPERYRVVDWHPTLLKLAGAAIPSTLLLDGRDLWPVLTQHARSPHEAILLWGLDGPDDAALRMYEWKLLVTTHAVEAQEASRRTPGPVKHIELYDLSHDPGERTNLAPAYPARVQVGRDNKGAVGRYAAPFPFEGRIRNVVLELR